MWFFKRLIKNYEGRDLTPKENVKKKKKSLCSFFFVLFFLEVISLGYYKVNIGYWVVWFDQVTHSRDTYQDLIRLMEQHRAERAIQLSILRWWPLVFVMMLMIEVMKLLCLCFSGWLLVSIGSSTNSWTTLRRMSCRGTRALSPVSPPWQHSLVTEKYVES